ncbi:receptor-type tyrosine-protein phosphatase O-like [Littorina saxatilis]|uniref:protein-tyrosine-phosphatase n=1 Tax=Littorina saxatilis TaxID=31220 RepID=A0AAN9AML0_9CAEN
MYRRYRPKDTSHRTVNLEDTLHSRKSVSMILFPARVEVLHRNSNQYFLQEFQELLNKEKTFGYTSDVGNLDVNLVKNRYQHHLPYDHTRVKLYSRGDHGQDYINASYIKGARSPCDYLATQGPMVSTIPDFWKMVWEHRSPVIVMLSDLTENGQPKVDEYLPSSLNSVVQYGEVRVNLISASTLPHYTVRKMKLLVDKEQEREVTHYHLSGWTDQGSSQSLDDIADIVYIVTEETASSSSPVTVHCSEGTMRTCSFIALHSLQRHVTQHAVGEDMDVFTVLLNIVKCRPHMMQSERQYMFIHDVVRVMVERKMRDGQGRSALYQNAGYRDSALYDSTYAYIPDGHVYDEIGARKKTQTSEL